MTCEKGDSKADDVPQEPSANCSSHLDFGDSLGPLERYSGLLEIIEMESGWGTPGPIEFGKWEERRGGKAV
jgi:hypothetical protein